MKEAQELSEATEQYYAQPLEVSYSYLQRCGVISGTKFKSISCLKLFIVFD